MKISIEISGNKEMIPNVTKENLILMIEAFGLKNSITVVKKKYALFSFKILPKADDIELTCCTLNKTTNLSIDATLSDVFVNMIGYLGYCKALVTNLTVKNQFGLKIKPVIEIFVKKCITFELPPCLEYAKCRQNINNDSKSFSDSSFDELSEASQVFFDNEILASLLAVTDLTLFSDNQMFRLKCLSGVYYIYYKPLKEISLVTDYLLDHSIIKELRKHTNIYKFHKEFDIFFNNNRKANSIDKNLFSKLFTNKNIPRGLREFLEHVPRYQDERDELVQNLLEYYNTNTKGTISRKGDYLSIETSEYVEFKNKHSIGNFRKD